MSVARLIVAELFGLFVDDGALALEILAVVAAAGIAVHLMPSFQLMAGGLLLLGCISVLAANCVGAARS
jgi:hypothetical protein